MTARNTANDEFSSDLAPGYMFPAEAAGYLRTTERKLRLFRKYGLVKWAKFGKTFVYRREWLDSFAEEWGGSDLSNESKIRLALRGRAWEKAHSPRA